ncbi:DNA polymerase [Xanthomonas phage XAJ2]|uniref:DNA polymerase n=1 Tax=Xanthomonas phage XAJ2 TaxID=1775249 RepID=A0A1I9L2F6_9CAUD|nr:DNA polymerase [Xanthomonas phage XAJ2]
MFFNDAPAKLKRHKRQGRTSFARMNYRAHVPEVFTDEDLMNVPVGDVWVYDVESYPNYWCVCFLHVTSGKVVYFEDSPDAAINIAKLRWMLWRFCLIGFNSIKYDLPIVNLAILGHRAPMLFQATKDLIEFKMKRQEFQAKYHFESIKINHVDLLNVAPLDGSLKLYAGRMHQRRLQDLPYAVGSMLSYEQSINVRNYCMTDLENTAALYMKLKPQVDLREALGIQYSMDLRSKSDAQISEAVVNSELKKISGKWPHKPKADPSRRIHYQPPAWVQFQTPGLQAALRAICATSFGLDAAGSPVWPQGLGERTKSKSGKEVWELKVTIGGHDYKLGMGGLHSQEKSVSHKRGSDWILADIDVASFYPRLILNERLFPEHLGEDFLLVYDKIVTERLAAKSAGNNVIADSLKIVINGGFGKFGNMHSTLYAPDLMLQVTLTGQLALLMLIEAIMLMGIEIISGNTDGIVTKCPIGRYEEMMNMVAAWEKHTSLQTEETRYDALYAKDVNNYIAVKLDFDKKAGKWTDKIMGCKTKGVYAEKGSALNSVLSKNPETLIVTDAVQKLILDCRPIEETVYACKDFTRFVSVKNARGGAEKDGIYLGKVVRWYYAEGTTGHINLVGTGNVVGKTETGKPCMDLPEFFPDDLNYDWYINKINKTLYDIGYYEKQQKDIFEFA